MPRLSSLVRPGGALTVLALVLAACAPTPTLREVGVPEVSPATRAMYGPVLDAYVRALPHTFRDVLAPEGTHVRLRISGEAGDAWSLVRHEGRWGLYTGVDTEPAAGVTLDQDEAWRLFTRGITPEAARAWCVFEGDAGLASKVLDAVGVIA